MTSRTTTPNSPTNRSCSCAMNLRRVTGLRPLACWPRAITRAPREWCSAYRHRACGCRLWYRGSPFRCRHPGRWRPRHFIATAWRRCGALAAGHMATGAFGNLSTSSAPVASESTQAGNLTATLRRCLDQESQRGDHSAHGTGIGYFTSKSRATVRASLGSIAIREDEFVALELLMEMRAYA